MKPKICFCWFEANVGDLRSWLDGRRGWTATHCPCCGRNLQTVPEHIVQFRSEIKQVFELMRSQAGMN